TPAESVSDSSTDIGDLAEKLQSVERITPIEGDISPKIEAESPETQSSYDPQMVTPTLAEIYASQGELSAAIQAYEILMFSQPGKSAEFQQRIWELQKLQAEKEG
ncbi:MAG: hypothetical protein PHP42_02655, partial [Bacteroidota bacterium]|nr:hypothetical protein [Bacteroidota bacterium]